MAELQSTNVLGALCVNGVAVGGSKDLKYCCYSSSTTFTPSQDLVDGDGYLHADVIGASGGGGSYGVSDWSCFYYCSQDFLAGDDLPGNGGFAQEPRYVINSTDACTVTVGAAGNSGSVVWDGYADCGSCTGRMCFTSSAATIVAGTAGGNSQFGCLYGYGGRGQGSIAFSCRCGSPSSKQVVENTPSADPDYCYLGQSSQFLDLSSAFGSATSYNTNYRDYTANSGNCTQYGNDQNLGKQGIITPVIQCGIGHCSNAPHANHRYKGCLSQRQCSTCTLDQFLTLTGYVGDGGAALTNCAFATRSFSHCTGSCIPGQAPFGLCFCQRGTEAEATFGIETSIPPIGTDGIVVIQWNE